MLLELIHIKVRVYELVEALLVIVESHDFQCYLLLPFRADCLISPK